MNAHKREFPKQIWLQCVQGIRNQPQWYSLLMYITQIKHFYAAGLGKPSQ